MKTSLDCLPCMMFQALRTGRITLKDDKKIKILLDNVADMIKNIPMDSTPPETAARIHQKIKELTGNNDPFLQTKRKNIEEVKAIYPKLKEYIKKSDNKLLTAARLAIAGNVIDLGVNKKFHIVNDAETILHQDFAIFDFDAFEGRVAEANKVLYIGDNAGETVFDKLLIEQIPCQVIYAVRDIPIINDATLEDAKASGLDTVAKLISSGSKAPATVLEQCNSNFLKEFYEADMVISKGQGNFEGLSNADRDIFFLLKAKCHVIAHDLNVNEDDIVLKLKQ